MQVVTWLVPLGDTALLPEVSAALGAPWLGMGWGILGPWGPSPLPSGAQRGQGGAGTHRVTPAVLQGHLLQAERPGGGHRMGGA